MVIENRLKQILFERNLTNVALAELTGIHRVNITNLVNAKTKRFDEDILNALCRALDCQISDFLVYVPEETVPAVSAKAPLRRSRNGIRRQKTET